MIESVKTCPPVISVIVPIYQIEIYLKECIESILSQSYPYLEIILVDDGSFDQCHFGIARQAQTM